MTPMRDIDWAEWGRNATVESMKGAPMPSAVSSSVGRFSSLTPETFWQLADDSKMLAEYKVDRNLRYLRTAPPEILKRIFVQYRFFTLYYITDLALLVAKLPFGSLRSCLAEFLSEELGDGDPTD